MSVNPLVTIPTFHLLGLIGVNAATTLVEGATQAAQATQTATQTGASVGLGSAGGPFTIETVRELGIYGVTIVALSGLVSILVKNLARSQNNQLKALESVFDKLNKHTDEANNRFFTYLKSIEERHERLASQISDKIDELMGTLHNLEKRLSYLEITESQTSKTGQKKGNNHDNSN